MLEDLNLNSRFPLAHAYMHAFVACAQLMYACMSRSGISTADIVGEMLLAAERAHGPGGVVRLQANSTRALVLRKTRYMTLVSPSDASSDCVRVRACVRVHSVLIVCVPSPARPSPHW